MVTTIRNNWFWPVAFLQVTLLWCLTAAVPNAFVPGFEKALLFDAVITLPTLFFICYRGRLPLKFMVVRIVALQCLGIWLASKLVPTSEQHILPALMWARYVGLSVLVLIEMKLAIVLFRLMFKSGVTEGDLTRQGMPRLIAKWAMMEARFWRWVLGLFRK